MSQQKRKTAELVANHNESTRFMVIWELAADGRDFCGVEFVARERGIEDEPLEAQVDAFVEDMQANEEEYRENADIDALEDEYGDVADDILEQ